MTDLITLPRATVQQALETWEHINLYGFVLADYEGPMEQAITALKAALEQPEQEPVAWMLALPDGRLERMSVTAFDDEAEEMLTRSISGCTMAPLYAHPPRREWRGLSEEEIKNAVGASAEFWATSALWIKSVARAIEAALRSKNHG
jgi:hypothetical protein